MGEAKHRKMYDPSYGKIPKKRIERGILISPPITIEGTEIHLHSTVIDPVELRSWLLFWDRLVWPSNRIVHIETPRDYEFLIDCGVLSRPSYQSFSSGNGADLLIESYVEILKEKSLNDAQVWAIAQGERTLQLIGKTIPDSRDILVNLHKAVPVPGSNVPFAEILEFKERRLPELYRFQHEIATLYEDIVNSADKPLALALRVERIESACEDLIKVNKEWKFESILSSFDFSITPMSWVGAITGFVGGQTYNLDTVSSLLAGTLGAAIAFTPSLGKRLIDNKNNPYRYAYLAHKELRF